MTAAGADRPSGPAPPRRRRRSRMLTGPLAVLALVASLLAVPAATSPDPAEAAVNAGWTQISAGYDHTCAVDTASRAWCWGDNTSGQIGDGTTTGRTTPTEVTGLPAVVDISAGQDHTCAVDTAGQAWCWGSNTSGQLGDGTTTDRTAPTQVTGLVGVIDISAGGGHTCAVTVETIAYCWGDSPAIGTASQPQPWHDGASAVSAGDSPTCIIRLGFVYCSDSGPVFMGFGGVLVTAGGHHKCAVDFFAQTWCWGDDTYGQLGDGTADNDWVSDAVGTTVISAGYDHTCAATNGSAPYCWGANDAGQLGDGTTTDRTTPTPVSDLVAVVDISAGGSDQFTAHTCAIDPAGTASCWGSNSSGQLGDGTTTDRNTPTKVPGFKESEQCQDAGGDRIIDSTVQGVRTFVYVHRPTTTEVWVCARVEDTATGDGYGGRLEATPTDANPQVTGLPGTPSTDSDSTACTTTTPNSVPGNHPIASGGVGSVDYMVDAYANGSEAWVCLQVGSSDHRVVVPLGSGSPQVQFGTVASWHPDEGAPGS